MAQGVSSTEPVEEQSSEAVSAPASAEAGVSQLAPGSTPAPTAASTVMPEVAQAEGEGASSQPAPALASSEAVKPEAAPTAASTEGLSPQEAPGASQAASEPHAADAPEGEAGPKKAQRWLPLWLRVIIVVVIAAVVVVGALAGAFAWDRWYRYDDVADFQGQWYPTGSTVPVEIGPDTIVFDDQTAYTYELDTHDKTVTYKLGSLQGQGHYWFTDDRATLVVWDGDSFDATSTALDDLGRLVSGLDAAADGTAVGLPQGEDVIAFTRTVDPAAVAAKEEAERLAREAEEAKERAEQAEREAQERRAAEAAEREAAGESPAEEEAPYDFTNESMGFFE